MEPVRGVEPLTCGLRNRRGWCCSILLDTELEHSVQFPAAILYLRCCPVLPAAYKCVSKMLANTHSGRENKPRWNQPGLSFCPLGKDRHLELQVLYN